jgi:hypothetical protein
VIAVGFPVALSSPPRPSAFLKNPAAVVAAIAILNKVGSFAEIIAPDFF